MNTNQTLQRAERSRGQRAGLDLERIVEAARRIDHSALSMQVLADALNVDRKALNYHVKERQTLLSLLAQDAFDGRFVASGVANADCWEAAVQNFGRSFVEAVLSLGELAEHLWFDDFLTELALVPCEALFEHLRLAGFQDETAVRLITMLVTLCLGHARDLIQAEAQPDRPRPRSLKATLKKTHGQKFPNLARISQLAVDTYCPTQIDFEISVLLEGARLRLAKDYR